MDHAPDDQIGRVVADDKIVHEVTRRVIVLLIGELFDVFLVADLKTIDDDVITHLTGQDALTPLPLPVERFAVLTHIFLQPVDLFLVHQLDAILGGCPVRYFTEMDPLEECFMRLDGLFFLGNAHVTGKYFLAHRCMPERVYCTEFLDLLGRHAVLTRFGIIRRVEYVAAL